MNAGRSKQQQLGRKSRIDVSKAAADSASDELDPIAAATAAKQRKTVERLKNAAAAAANSMPAHVRTVIADAAPSSTVVSKTGPPRFATEPQPSSQNEFAVVISSSLTKPQKAPEQPSFVEQLTSSPTTGSQSASENTTPSLAELLGYSDASSEGSSDDDSQAADSDAEEGMSQFKKSAAETDDLDKELANFMEELETSGLLKDDTEAGPAAPNISVTNAEPDVAAEGSGRPAAASPPPDSGAAQHTSSSSTSEAAEQQVQGYLADDPNWCKVLDAGSNKIYFWHVVTNEVVWAPPPGLNGDRVLPPQGVDEQHAEQGVDRVCGSEAGGGASPVAVAGNGATDEEMSVPAAQQPCSGQEDGATSGSDADNQGAGVVGVFEAGSGAQASSEEAEEGQLVDYADDDPQEDPAPQVSRPPSTSSSPSQAAALLLTQPSPDLESMFASAVKELQGCAGALLARVPALLRLAIEAELRRDDWQALMAAQQSAVLAGDLSSCLSWPRYERHLQGRMKELSDRLPAAMSEAKQLGEGEGVEAGALSRQPSTEDMELEAESLLGGSKAALTQPSGYASWAAPGFVGCTTITPALYPGYDPSYYYSGGGGYAPPVPPLDSLPPMPPEPAPPLPTEDIPPPPEGADDVAADDAPTPPPPGLEDVEAEPPPQGGGLLGLGDYEDDADGGDEDDEAAVTAAAPSSEALAYVSEQLAAAAAAAAAAQAAASPPPRKKEYHAEPQRRPAAELVMAAAGCTGSGGGAEQVADGGAGMGDEGKKRRKEKVVTTGSALSSKKLKTGKMSELINKWSAVKKEVVSGQQEADRRAAAKYDVEAAAALKREEIDKWREGQLRSGQAQENANFQPVSGDWRVKLRAAKSSSLATSAPSSSGSAPSSLASASSLASGRVKNSRTRPDLAALSVGLPSGWTAMWDQSSGDIYYGNLATKVTQWERPA